LSNLPIGIVVYDSKNSISYANTHASRMLDLKLNKSGHQKSYSLVGRLIEDRSDNTGADVDPVSRVFETGRALTGVVYRYQFAGDTEARWYLLSAFPQYVNDEIENVITSVIDVTERRVNEAKIEQLAFNDVLTGLPNRPSFEKALVESIGLVQREKLYSALILFDIDNFNVINDSLGHRIGDRLLQLMASRLTDSLEEGAMLSRLGGDEFAILLSSDDLNESALREKVNVLANTLQQAFSKAFVVEGHQLNINISIGIALIPFDGLTVDMLLRRADAALYQSKKAGRNTMSFFEMEQENEIQRRLQLENEMREGLKNEQFCLEYQPKVDIETGDIVGAEALVRWKHPTHGVISPEEFIPVAEDSGLILALGEWVINEALSQTGRWQKEMPGFEKFERISVNVSPVQFNDAEFEDVVKRAIQSSGTVPEKLDIEITEGLLLDNTDRVVEKLGRFKELGVSFSIDDFGTGYSSLAYLKRLPVDVVKIDQSFVREMNSDEGDKAIVLAILAIAKSLGLTTVAEGVEEEEHLHSLKEMGCHVYQGYYYSKPLSPESFERLMHSSDVSLH
jgi:diguanylate cyclase (GGDEF)-like protein